MGQDNEIIFEDLHGVQEDKPVTVDLDAELNDDGITRAPAEQAADDDSADDDEGALDAAAAEDDSAGDDDDDASASKDGDDDAYSKKVKARIERERRAKKKAQDEAKYWQSQAQKLADDTSKRNKAELKSRIEQADAKLVSVQEALDRAIEDGNTKDQVKYISQLTDLKAEKIQAEYSLNDLPDDGNVPPFDGKVSPPTEKSLADQWVDDHSDWYGARGFERHTRLANRLDKEVYKDGYDPDSPEYFEELDRRMKEAAPDLYEDLSSEASRPKERPSNRRRQSPVAGVDSQGPTRKAGRGSKVELTEADFENMRRFNLNPKDPEVLKEYARNKAEGVRR